MDSVHFYEKKIDKDVIKMLGSDEFMRISHVVRESNVLHSEKVGYILYIQANPEEINNIEKKLKDLGAEKITGKEEKTIIDTLKTEEDNAATGMGMIFG